MGAYLSQPIVEKLSSDELNEFLDVGSSSMQGWRISQEDAHNCILKYDENTSLFAVYDGHGGAEVASYCADKFPDFLRKLKFYQDKDFAKALTEAFIQFDSTLLNEKVIEILKRLAGEHNPDQDSDAVEEEEEEDLNELWEEGSLPLDKVLAKYKAKNSSDELPSEGGVPVVKQLNKLKKDDTAGTSKPLSPCLRGRRNIHSERLQQSAGSSSSKTSSETSKNTVIEDQKTVPSNDDSVVSSSASATRNPKGLESSDDIKSNEAAPSNKNGSASPVVIESSSMKKISSSPDSSVVSASKENIQNGSNEQLSGVSSSSGICSSVSSNSSKVENGEISSQSNVESKICSPIRKSPSKTIGSSTGISSSLDADDSTSDSDADFEADDDSETDEGEEDCEPMIDDDEDTEDEEECDEEDDVDDDAYKDEQFCANMVEEPGKDSGCTAVVALLHGRDLYVANAGDSRCVVCRNGKAIDMSIDHKPEDEEESARITKAGGRVTLDGRVNGGLNLSRAIGDHAYKTNSNLPPEKQMISAMPDIKKLILSPEDEFMILACDGIWNYMPSEEVVAFVKERIENGEEKMSKICEELFEMCLAPNTLGDGTGCDNMTAVIVRFKPSILNLPTSIDPNDTVIAEQERKADLDVTKSFMEIITDEIRKSRKRSASPPLTIESSNNYNKPTTNDAESASVDSYKVEINEPCQKRIKTDETVDSSSFDTTNCSSNSSSNSNSNNVCSSNGEAEVAAATASIAIHLSDVASTESTTET